MSAAKEFEEYARECVRLAIQQDNKEIRQQLLDMGAPSLGVELMPVDVHRIDEIERTINAFASGSNGGLVVTSSTLAIVHRELIIALAVHHRLPTA
jgi:Zn-dependent protease with chaperone function